MWWAEHAIMATVFCGFAIWLIVKGNWSWLGAAALSQVPFWGGLAAFLISGDQTPVSVNLFLNMAAAAAFVEWGSRLQRSHRGGVVQIWLAWAFLGACSLDILQVVYPTSVYVLSQEIIHYLALMIIGGRAYVRGFDGGSRLDRHNRDTQTGGGMV